MKILESIMKIRDNVFAIICIYLIIYMFVHYTFQLFSLLTAMCVFVTDQRSLFTSPPPVDEKYIAISVSVRCMSVCRSVCQLTYLKNHISRFLYMLPVALVRSSSDDIAICYVYPVL